MAQPQANRAPYGRMSRRRALVLSSAVAAQAVLARPSAAMAWAQNAPSDFTGLNGTLVHFAGVAEARALLSSRDDWMRATSSVQRAALMDRAPPVSLEDFARWQAAAVLPWTPALADRWRRALARIAATVNRLDLPLPPTVMLVRTTGRESAATPHTRGAAIVLPERIDEQGFSDAEVLAHELFHVMSRHAPALSQRVYGVLGFEPVGELQWPAAWDDLRIADQDAPHLRHAMKLDVRGRTRWLMPVVVASKRRPDLLRGETIENMMQTRLLEVMPGHAGAASQAVLGPGGPVWFAVDEVPGYVERLGGNTDYVLHPEETAADNFMLLVSGRRVPNPGLLQRIERALHAGNGPGTRPSSGAVSARGPRP